MRDQLVAVPSLSTVSFFKLYIGTYQHRCLHIQVVYILSKKQPVPYVPIHTAPFFRRQIPLFLRQTSRCVYDSINEYTFTINATVYWLLLIQVAWLRVSIVIFKLVHYTEIKNAVTILLQCWTEISVVHMTHVLIISRLCVRNDRLCGLVVRVSGYRYRGPGFDPRRYQIF